MAEIKTIDVGKEFFHRLANRDKKQGDGKYNAEEFRNKYLIQLDSPDKWKNNEEEVILDFQNVKKLGPSFANEAFAYFTKYAKPEQILKKIKIINISNGKLELINVELESGYTPSWKAKLGI